MKNVSKSKKTYSIFIALFLLISGTVAILLPYFILSKTSDYVETTAKITDIEYDIFNENYTAFVNYIVDGVEYNQPLDFYTSSYKIGKIIKIKYNPLNPENVTSLTFSTALPFFIIGGCFLITSIVLVIIKIKKSIPKKVDEHPYLNNPNVNKESEINQYFNDKF